MKRITKLSLVSLLLCVALLVALPGAVMADSDKVKVERIKGEMSVTSIDDTVFGVNVFPIFDGSWNLIGYQVVNRSVRGEIKGKLKGEWEFTYSATLDLLQQGTLMGGLQIHAKKGDVYGQASGTTATVGGGLDPEKGPYLDVVFSIDTLTIMGGTGKYDGISGTGSFGGYTQPVRVYVDLFGHVTGVEGKITLELYVQLDDDHGDDD